METLKLEFLNGFLIRQKLCYPRRGARRVVGANDRNRWEIPVEEDGRLGHDQVGVEIFPVKGRRIEVGKF